jgi:hypothetical protein
LKNVVTKLTRWRYYFILNDDTYKNILDRIKDGTYTKIFVVADFSQRTLKELYSAKTENDLLKITKKYRDRSKFLYDLTKKDKLAENFRANLMNIVAQGALDLETVIKHAIRYNA